MNAKFVKKVVQIIKLIVAIFIISEIQYCKSENVWWIYLKFWFYANLVFAKPRVI